MSHSRVVQQIISRASGPNSEQFIVELEEFLREKEAAEKRANQTSLESAREQFFNAIYARDVDLLTLLLTGSRRNLVHANMLSANDSWTPLHACLYKYNQFPPPVTLRIVKLLLEHGADVNRPCPTGAIAISVTDKKQPRRSGSEPAERESRLVRFQNKTALEVAIDFLQSYKWAGCRPALLERWTPLIQLLDQASQEASRQKSEDEQSVFYRMPKIEKEDIPVAYRKKFCRLFEEKIGCDCVLFCTSPLDDENKCNGGLEDGNQRTIEAHKCILMASSPVFEAMLSNKMREALESRIEISDVPFEVLKVMIRFMYFHSLDLPPVSLGSLDRGSELLSPRTGSPPPSSPVENVSEDKEDPGNEPESEPLRGDALRMCRDQQLQLLLPLLAASDKYHMPDLKHSVEWALQPFLEVESAIPIFISAHRHRASNLSNICLSFVCDNFSILSKRDEYEKLKEHPDLLALLLQQIVSSRNHR